MSQVSSPASGTKTGPASGPSTGQEAARPDVGPFVHLHLHSEYSLLDGGNQIDKLVARIADLGMKAVAVTDHGNLFGAAQFYIAAKEKGIKPILGVEAYVTPPGKPRSDRTYSGGGEGGYHTVLLAMNERGWSNLLVLCSEAYLTGFYYKPRIDRELLEKHSEGLIAINGHLGSEIGDHLLDFHRTREERCWHAAMESARWHDRVFNAAWRAAGCPAEGDPPPRFYVELQHHVAEQNAINPLLIKLAREIGAPLVCDNDAHFLKAEDHDAHDTLICISTGKSKAGTDRMRYTPELYVKSPEQMRALFEAYGEAGEEALRNTQRIAAACDVKLPIGGNNAPAVRIAIPDAASLPRPEEARFAGDLSAWYKEYCEKFEVQPFRETPTEAQIAEAKKDCDTALRMLAEAGFRWRYGRNPGGEDDAFAQRLRRELKILADKNISAYFLIVWDFVNWGRQRGIPACARGSGVGTMVGYVLALSNACPVQYGLLFERFTDPDRSEYPDIDIDLCQDGRPEVIEHVRRKYGHVAQIITFGTLKARAAIRDVGRVLDFPLPEVDRIAKLIPETLNIEIKEALDQEPELKKMYDGDDRVRRLLDNAIALEGHTRHAGVHAAGVIVATRPLHEIVPLYKAPGTEDSGIVTQWDGPTCEKMGLLKMDFLGLRTLSIIERARKLIRETLSEEEIWAAVGRREDYEKWRSGGVAQWQSESQDIPRPGGLAEGHETRGGDLSRNTGHAAGGSVRIDKPDAPGRDLRTDEHRGGLRQVDTTGVSARSPGGDGFSLRADDGLRVGDESRDAQAKSSRQRTPGRRGSPAPSTDTLTGKEDREGGEETETFDLTTAPLRHSATPPLPSLGDPSLLSTDPLPPHPLDLERLSYNDQKVFELFRRGDTTGVFQFESGGMRRLLTEMKPDRLEDLIAANALFRPGPMDLIPDYNRRKHGADVVPKVHEIVDSFTAETYGVMVYQEQVMQIVHGLGGIKLRDAYTLIKNISKKKHDKIEKERPKFVDGAQKQGLTRQAAEDLFELILKFAGYGFNKSHSTGYAIVAYQTAYLKTYFPNQYMAAFLTYESGANKVSDWIPYLEDCRKTRFVDPATGKVVRTGVEVRPPDINLSQADFSVVFDENEPRTARNGHIRFGLSAIKGAGDKAIAAVLRERDGTDGKRSGGPFTSLFDFCERIPPGLVNKATIESLVKCGAFDSLHGRPARAAMLATIEQALNAGQKAARDKAAGQSALFGGGGGGGGGGGDGGGKPAAEPAATPLARAEAWSEADTLTKEKEVLGFYVSSHPLDRWKGWTNCFATHTTAAIKECKQDQRVVVGAMIQSVRTVVVKNGRSAGQKMAIVTVEDSTGACDCVLFTDAYQRFGHLATGEGVVFVLGRIDLSRGDAQIIVDRLAPIDGTPLEPGRIRLFVDELKLNGGAAPAVLRIADILRTASAPAPKKKGDETPRFPVELVIGTLDQVAVLATDPSIRLTPTPDLFKSIETEIGAGMIRVTGVAVEANDNSRGKWRGKRQSSPGDDE